MGWNRLASLEEEDDVLVFDVKDGIGGWNCSNEFSTPINAKTTSS